MDEYTLLPIDDDIRQLIISTAADIAKNPGHSRTAKLRAAELLLRAQMANTETLKAKNKKSNVTNHLHLHGSPEERAERVKELLGQAQAKLATELITEPALELLPEPAVLDTAKHAEKTQAFLDEIRIPE